MTSASPSDAWLIFACRTSYVSEVAEIIWRAGAQIQALIDNWEGDPLTNPEAEVIDARKIPDDALSLPVVIAPSVPGHRYQALQDARARGLHSFPALIDPTAIVARSVTIGEGTTVNAGTVIGASTTIKTWVCVNRSASIGHDNVIEDYASIGPGCTMGGFVTVGRGAFLGVGATCAPKVSIGANATVGAGAVVIRDVPPNAVVVGNPAKILKTSEDGYGGVSVPL